MVRFLSEEIVLAIHDDLIRLYGGTYGVRDSDRLDAAIQMPRATFDGDFWRIPAGTNGHFTCG